MPQPSMSPSRASIGRSRAEPRASIDRSRAEPRASIDRSRAEPHASTNIVDAVSGEEVCPLCFDRFSDADACSCVVCRVSSCPSCAEVLDADGAVRCFACRPPAQVAARAPAAEALVSAGERSKAAPLSLPRPIAIPNAASAYTPGYGAAALPPPPFPLTTSPQGVRRLQPKPPGSVFVGLPAVSQQLAQSLQLQAQREKRVEPKPRLARRPQQKLVLLAYVLTVAAELFALGRRAVIFARRVEVHAWLARALAASTRALHTGMSLAQQRARALGTLIEQHAKPRARVLLTRAARLVLRSKSKRAVPRASVPSRTARVDPSRPIHL